MFRSLVFISSLVLFSAVLASAEDPGRQWGPNGVGCNFYGNGGGVQLFPPHDENHWVKYQFFKLQEVDVNGTVVAQADNFGGFAFAWVSVGNSSIFGAKALQFNLIEPFLHIRTVNSNPTWNPNHTFSLPTNTDFFVNLQVTSYLFLQNFTTTFAGENIIGKEGQVKWSLSVSGWKFQSTANKLQYSIQLFTSDSANNTNYKRLNHVPGTIASYAIGFGVGNIIVPTVALADGNSVTVASTVSYTGGQLAITWDFPWFNNTLVYDPITAASDLVIADTTTTSSGITDKSISAMAMIAAVAITLFAINRQD